MAETSSLNIDSIVRRRAATSEEQPTGESGIQDWAGAPYSFSLLGDSRLDHDANASVRASVISSAQKTHGNRAVQRSFYPSARWRQLSVQRSLWGDATSWIGDRASDVIAHPLDSLATAGAYMPVPGNPLMISKAGEDINSIFGAGRDSTGNPAPSLFEHGVSQVESGISSTAYSLADRVSDVPVLGSVAGAGARAVDLDAQITGGAWKALGGMAGGIGSVLAHPVDAAMGMEKMAENVGLPGYMNPFRQAHAAYDVISGNRGLGDAANHWLNPIEGMKQSQEFGTTMLMGQQDDKGDRHGGLIEGYRESAQEGKYGEIVGRAGVDIGSFFLGAGEAGAAGKVGSVAGKLGEMGEIGAATRGAGEVVEAASIAARRTEMVEAARGSLGAGVEGSDAAHAAEGLEGERSAEAIVKRSPTRPVGLDEKTEVTQLGSRNDAPLVSQAPVELPPTTTSAAPVPTRGQVPAPIELPPLETSAKTPVADKGAAFRQLARGDIKLTDAPETLNLPDEVNKGMQQSWKDTFQPGQPQGQEQGGIFTMGQDDSVQWKQGKVGTSDDWTPNFGDIDRAAGERLAGSAHTHPDGTSFSDTDLSSIIHTGEPMQFVQSGPEMQVGSARTEEFNSRLTGLDAKGKAMLGEDMSTMFDSVLNQAVDAGISFEESVEQAVKTVHSKFDLLYYKGKDGLLTMQ